MLRAVAGVQRSDDGSASVSARQPHQLRLSNGQHVHEVTELLTTRRSFFSTDGPSNGRDESAKETC